MLVFVVLVAIAVTLSVRAAIRHSVGVDLQPM
jgi:hypothetical protein